MAASIYMECVCTTRNGEIFRKCVTMPVQNDQSNKTGFAIARVIQDQTVRPMLCLAEAVADLCECGGSCSVDNDVDQAEEAFINAAKLFRTAYGRYDAKNKLDGADTELLDMKKGTERW